MHWMCKEKEKSIECVLSEWSKLAQNQHNSRPNKEADVVHWSLCHKYGLQCTSITMYEHYGRLARPASLGMGSVALH